MILPIKKCALSGMIALLMSFTSFTTYTKNSILDFNNWDVALDVISTSEPTITTISQSFDLGNSFSNHHKCDSTTHTHALSVTNHDNYDAYTATCTNNETKDFIQQTAIIYHDDLHSTHAESPSHDINNSHSTMTSHDNDHWKDEHARGQIIDARNEEINNAQTTQNKSTNLSNSQMAKLHKITSEYNWQANNSKFYCAAISPKTVDFKINKSSDTIAALKLSAVQERLQHFKELRQKACTIKENMRSKNFKFVQKEIIFIDTLLSGEIVQLLEQVLHADLKTAHSALSELKDLSPYNREYQFLVPLFSSDREEEFIHSVIGEDIIKIAEQDLFSRQDYIAHYANEQEQKIIQSYKEKCILLQQKGDIVALRNERKNVCFSIVIKNNKNDFIANACLAIAEKTLQHPITTVFSNIRHTQSLEKARLELINFEIQIVDQAQKINLIHTDQIKQWTIDHYGFDVLDAAQRCYQSRTDYIATPENQSFLSDKMHTIVNNIEQKDLPSAHAELVHLDKQMDKILSDRNITDPIAQKEYIKKSFGKDVLDLAHNAYESRADHKNLVESFMAIDVNQAATRILENNNSYESVANEMNDLAQHVFGNARLCNLSNLPKIESHVYGSIDAMRTAQDHPTFIFNFSMASRTLGDIQQIAHAILSGTHPVLGRSSELLTKGFSAFFKGLNPLTQASNMGHLAYDLGSLLKKGGTALWNDPIATTHNGITSVFTLTKLIRNTADFTSDLTVGRLYLSPEQYQQRIDAFCEIMEPLQGITAQHCSEFLGQLAADVVFFKGLGNAYNFLKEIDILEKLGESAAAVARTFKKGFDTHLADNPIVITAEGVVLQMSNDLKNIGGAGIEIITNSRMFIESMTSGFLAEVKADIENLKKIFACPPKCPQSCPKRGFAEFINGHIKIPYEHILGMELKWAKEGNLVKFSGFHHDFMNTMEKNGTIQFINKITNEHGCYKASLIVDGLQVPTKTFFPSHWSREKVVSKIYEAYDQFIKSGAIPFEKNGKYVVEGLTQEGINIRMFITKNGQIATAYPVL